MDWRRGEKSTELFVNPEKCRAENINIYLLVKRDGEIVTGGSEVYKEIKKLLWRIIQRR